MNSTQHKAKFQAIKGVRDILPPDSALWNRVEQTAREVFGSFGFSEIRLPIFEQTELFARSIGVETDSVVKEMFTFYDPFDLPELVRRYSELQKELQEANAVVQNNTSGQEISNAEKARAALYQALLRTKPRDTTFSKHESDTGIERGQFLSLRPEATASVVRAYIEHGMHVQPGNVKLYYMGPMFRRERPQKGRYRQFYQIGAEVLGHSDAPGVDAEVIEMLMTFFARIRLEGAALYINSIGHSQQTPPGEPPVCRRAYVEKLRAELEKVRDQLGPDSQRRIETNPLRVLDSKVESEQAIIEKLPRIGENLCADCRAHYDEVKRQLALRGIAYQENWRLVRGLDYYMRTTFEITAPGLGSQNAVCGGGRYDGLVELLGGPKDTKGIGFAIGTDRLILSLQEAGEGDVSTGLDVYLAWFGAAAQTKAIGLARRLREAGFVVELPAVEMKFGKSLGLADRLKARHAVIIGEDEVAAGVVTVKRLADGKQQKLAEAELLAYLRGE